MANVFKCIITVIEAETNSKCSPSDEEFLARKYGTQLDAVVQVSIDPVWCNCVFYTLFYCNFTRAINKSVFCV